MLSELLYSQLELRPPILKALKTMIEANSGDEPERSGQSTVTEEEAKSNLEFLNSQAESWFAVLFNVFDSVEAESRNVIGDVIRSFASIADEEVCL